jgi:hypothetical protein
VGIRVKLTNPLMAILSMSQWIRVILCLLKMTNPGQWIRVFGCRGILYILLYCKKWRYDEYNIRGVALNRLLVFPVWVSRVKSLCNVCVCVPLYFFCFY